MNSKSSSMLTDGKSSSEWIKRARLCLTDGKSSS